MTPSKARANQIAQRVLDALREADEIGGPERPEYIAMMQNIARICSLRAATAETTAPERDLISAHNGTAR